MAAGSDEVSIFRLPDPENFSWTGQHLGLPVEPQKFGPQAGPPAQNSNTSWDHWVEMGWKSSFN
ncbi:hypothetical protein L484_001404 [Morus notabilis]|uniref:Uncharacterized protein n=1 Tax=Morus notabilis TaxID=981085 RepID=W9S4R2_9ROSA|nr:hypothetical protein L484_001404 [Morus notabilis]